MLSCTIIFTLARNIAQTRNLSLFRSLMYSGQVYLPVFFLRVDGERTLSVAGLIFYIDLAGRACGSLSFTGDNLLQSMLAHDYIFESAAVGHLRLHKLHEVVSDVAPLPIKHNMKQTGKGDCLCSKEHTLNHVHADVAIGKRLASQHHDSLPVDLCHFLLKQL